MRWINDIRTWVPRRYTQDELLIALGLAENVMAKRIFGRAAITHRHLLFGPKGDGNEVQRKPRLEDLGIRRGDVVIEVSNQAKPCYLLGADEHVLVRQEWCPGILQALRLADQRSGCCRVVTVDINSALQWQADFRDANDIVAYALFGDGIACAAVHDSRTSEASAGMVAFSRFDFETVDLVRYDHGRWVMNHELPDRAPTLVWDCVGSLLHAHGLTTERIQYWLVHPAGRKVLDLLGERYGLEPHLHFSRSILAKYGNIGASSLLFILKEVQAAGPTVGAYGVMVGYGPGPDGGFRVTSCLLQW